MDRCAQDVTVKYAAHVSVQTGCTQVVSASVGRCLQCATWYGARSKERHIHQQDMSSFIQTASILTFQPVELIHRRTVDCDLLRADRHVLFCIDQWREGC